MMRQLATMTVSIHPIYDRVKQMANFLVLLNFPTYSPLKARIAMKVMKCTVPMPPSICMAILSQLAHVACGICDSNTIKNDQCVIALKLLQHMRDIIIYSLTRGCALEDFEIKDAWYITPIGVDEMHGHCWVCLIIWSCPVVCSPRHFLSLNLYLCCFFG